MAIYHAKGPKSLSPRQGLPFFRGIWAVMIKHCYFGTKKRVEFYRVLRSLTQNGISIQASLQFFSTMIGKYQKSESSLKFILDDILRRMKQGTRFEVAISHWIPTAEVVLVQASAKDVTSACEIITRFSENMLSIQSALIGALTYPIAMILVLIGSMTGFTFYVIPIMTKLSDPSHWPPMAKALYSFTSLIADHTVLIVSMFVAFIVFTSWSLKKLTFMPIRCILDKLPPWNIYKPYASTSFLIALASLLRTGSSYNHALRGMRQTASPYLKQYLDKILKRLAAGSNFGESLVVGLFNGTILISLCVFAMTNRLEQGIQFLADENLEEQRLVFIRKGKILGYVLMFVVAGVIGWVMLSLYGMQTSIQ